MNKTNHDRTWELVSAKIHNEAADSEKKELESSSSDPEKQRIQEDVSKIHDRLKGTAPLYNSSINHSWDLVVSYFRQKRLKKYKVIMRYAAIIVLAFGTGTFFSGIWKSMYEQLPLYSEITAPPGQMSEIILYDSTRVWLNSGTKLRYTNDFGKDSRRVELEGEAFFQVKSGTIPFMVKIKNNEVEVLGTSFAAEAYPDEDFSRVTLIEGEVLINDHTGQVISQLEPNQQIHLPDNVKEKIVTREVSTLFYESWIDGQIKFDDERLADVARRLERWYNVEINFKDKEAGDLRFTGTVLKTKPIDQSMKAISLLLPITVSYNSNLDKKDVITISKK